MNLKEADLIKICNPSAYRIGSRMNGGAVGVVNGGGRKECLKQIEWSE